jgi:hypothetical protein
MQQRAQANRGMLLRITYRYIAQTDYVYVNIYHFFDLDHFFKI